MKKILLAAIFLFLLVPVKAGISGMTKGTVNTNTSATSLGNSSVTPLGSGATFTGTGELNDYPQVGVMVKTDNTGTLYFDFSNDGTNWDSTFPVAGFGIASGISEFHTAVKLGRYFRVRLVNDTGAQSYLRLTTYYGDSFLPSAAPINQAAGLDQDAIFVRPTIPQDEIRIAKRGGVTGWTKFGYKDTLTAANGEQLIWPTLYDDFTILTSAETFDIEYSNGTDGSTTTGATQLTFFYIDANGMDATAAHTLGSTGNDSTSFTGLGINRMAVSATNGDTFNNGDISIYSTTTDSLQAFIPAQQSVTQQPIYFVGANSDAVAKFLWENVSKPGGGNAVITIKGYVYNRAVDTRYEVYRSQVDTSIAQTEAINEPVGFNLSPTDVLYFVADTDTNNAGVRLRFSLVEYERD